MVLIVKDEGDKGNKKAELTIVIRDCNRRPNPGGAFVKPKSPKHASVPYYNFQYLPGGSNNKF